MISFPWGASPPNPPLHGLRGLRGPVVRGLRGRARWSKMLAAPKKGSEENDPFRDFEKEMRQMTKYEMNGK